MRYLFVLANYESLIYVKKFIRVCENGAKCKKSSQDGSLPFDPERRILPTLSETTCMYSISLFSMIDFSLKKSIHLELVNLLLKNQVNVYSDLIIYDNAK